MSRSFLCLCAVFACVLEHDANQPFALSESGRRAHHRRYDYSTSKKGGPVFLFSQRVVARDLERASKHAPHAPPD